MKLLPTPSTNQARYRERQAHIPALTAIYIDIDHFKQINDTYGHPAGDVVLRTLAVQLRKLLQDSDLICRFGGEEFVVLLPDDATDALRVAEKIRTAIANVDFGIKDLLGITISIGLCSVACQVPLDQLLSRADAALYAAKQSGRNQWWCFLSPIDDCKTRCCSATSGLLIKHAYKQCLMRQCKQG